MGAGSVVAVQEARPAVHRAIGAKPKAAKPRAAARPAAAATPIAAATAIAPLADCALPSVDTGGLASVPALDSGSGFGDYFPAGGGGGFGPEAGLDNVPTPLPGIPEPAAWGLMVSGFGLIGLAMRRPGKVSAKKPAEARG